MLQFTNALTAQQFEALTDADRIITKQKQYHGKLSDIPPLVAEGMVQRRSNLLKKRPVPQVQPVLQKATVKRKSRKPPVKA